MMYFLICTIAIIFVVKVQSDLIIHDKVFNRRKEVKLKRWMILLIIIVGFTLPINIILFLGWLLWMAMAPFQINEEYSLKGNNCITKMLKKIWKYLNKTI